MINIIGREKFTIVHYINLFSWAVIIVINISTSLSLCLAIFSFDNIQSYNTFAVQIRKYMCLKTESQMIKTFKKNTLFLGFLQNMAFQRLLWNWN